MMMGGNEEKIFVSVRLRPMNAREISRNDVSDWDCINEQTIVYRNVSLSVSERSMYPTAYTFDRVFRSDCSTREVYEQGAKEVATSVVRGLNASIFAYGQTSSGKTYTMTGITEFALADIYEYIRKHPEREFVLKFSAMEIYNESVRDLLSEDIAPLRLLDDPERGTVVEKLTEEILKDWNHVIHLLSICDAQRQIGETSLNEMSSRSHQIIRLTIESSSREFLGRDSASTLSATVNFVDLAGSERASQSLSAGTRLKEGCHINRSLLTLGTVIRKLSNGRNGHIPYRDSKLTRILQPSLGGNARTAIICTMSPARSHVEQSRNTLLFASCAKEVTTSAQVNVVMSDKALVKYLQKEISRLENEMMRISQSTDAPSSYNTILRDKDIQIEKLEGQINDLILERDIARSKVKDTVQIIGDEASCLMQEQNGHYPRVQLQISTDRRTIKQETSIVANPGSTDVDTVTQNGHSRATSTQDHTVEAPYFNNYIRSTASPATSINSRNSSEVYSYNGWEQNEKQSNEDACREVHCIETDDSNRKGAKESESFSGTGFPEVSTNRDGQTTVPSIPSGSDQVFKSFSFKRQNETKEDRILVSASFLKDEPLPKEDKGFSSTRYDASSLESQSSTRIPDKALPVSRSFKLSRSRSCKARIGDSLSPWFKMMYYSENTPSEITSIGFDRNPSPFSCFNLPSSSRIDSSRRNAYDIEIDTPNLKFASAEDVISSSTTLPNRQLEEIETKAKEARKKNMEDVGLDPIEVESTIGLSSWTLEFKRLQREIIELWQACNVSLVYRTNFFMYFQGEPADAVYLEVELRRMKFLKDKVSRGDKIIVNGRSITLASSAKALLKERKMLSKRMSRKLSVQERESLFLKWGIGITTKHRRLQLAHCLWTKTEDTDHISDSAFLIWKLVGFLEQGQTTPTKEMFGLNFTPEHPTRTRSSIRRSLQFLS